MRILTAGACLLSLAACNNNQTASETPGETQAVSETLSGNDVTAIDAATDASANMAADVEPESDDLNLANEANGNEGAGNAAERNTL